MPCHAAIISDLKIVSADTVVEDCLSLMKKNKQTVLPVLSDDEQVLGYVTFKSLLKTLLPVSVHMSAEMHSPDLIVGAAPGIAKRLKKIAPLAVREVMEHKIQKLTGETPLWKGINMIISSDEPVFVVDEDHDKYLGVMDEKSALMELERLQT